MRFSILRLLIVTGICAVWFFTAQLLAHALSFGREQPQLPDWFFAAVLSPIFLVVIGVIGGGIWRLAEVIAEVIEEKIRPPAPPEPGNEAERGLATAPPATTEAEE